MTARLPPEILRQRFGGSIEIGEIGRLKEFLKGDPDFRDARLMLMSARNCPRELRAEQLDWFIEHEPGTFLGHYGWMAIAGEGMTAGRLYEERKLRWLAAVDRSSDNIDVIENAAWFMIWFEPHEGADLLDDGAKDEPSAERARRAVIYLDNAADAHPAEAASHALRALKAGYRVFRIEPKVQHRLELLPTMTKCAKTGALLDAVKLLKLAEKVAKAWYFTNGDLRVQLGHAVSGLVALAQQDAEGAEQLLRDANAVNALPTESLVAFATELAARGGTDAVIGEIAVWKQRFLDCAVDVDRWAEALQCGEQATPPHFPPKKRD